VQPDNQIDRAPGLADGTSPIAPKHGADSELLEERGVWTSVAPGTGRRIKASAGVVAIVLLIAFSAVHFLKASGASKLLNAARSAASQRPPVNVITVGNAAGTRPLSLPGATAAWNETTIYARVNGYVAKWHVDIGDHVQRGQTLASIDTPELEAELTAARVHASVLDAHRLGQSISEKYGDTAYRRLHALR
jgi:multidrug efflux pump subunit AcrA (membrane-fusion protein)